MVISLKPCSIWVACSVPTCPNKLYDNNRSNKNNL